MKISQIAADKIRVGGRTTECREPLSLVWGGSYIELNVKARELKVLLAGPYETYENWIAIEINGEVLSRRMVSKEPEWITVFRMMNPSIPTKVRILKEGQAFESDSQHRLEFYEIETDGQLLAVEEKKLKIEFIGDSINSAEGCIGAVCEQEWIAQFFSHTNSYPYMISKMLNADIKIISQSGWGVYAAWDCDLSHVIPRYYEGVCSLMPKGYFDQNGFYDKWDFSKWQPDAIVINLGTNDDFAFKNEDCPNRDALTMEGDKYKESDRMKVRDAIVDFLEMVRRNNPEANIYWAFGILGCLMGETIQEAIEIYNNKSYGKKVSYIALPETQDDEFGSRSHPGVKAHRKAADKISGVIKRDLM